jgi:hypothetical protein
MSKKKYTAEESKIIAETMKAAVTSPDREQLIANLVGDVYDYELPVSPVIEALSTFSRVGNRAAPGGCNNRLYMLTPDSIDKKVFVITSDCNVEQLKVTPNTKVEIPLVPVITEDYWVCLTDFLSGDHDVLALYAKAIREALDRKEIKNVIALLDAGAEAESNTFTLDSDKTALDFPKLVAMRKSLKKYGTEFILITGENVEEDIDLMDYTANTFRMYDLEKLGIRHIPILSYTVDTDDSGQEALIDANAAYLVAVKDANGDMPVVFGRRDVSAAGDMSDTEVQDKDTLIFTTGNVKPIVGGAVKYARGKAGYREIGSALKNSKVVAKFTLA